MSRPINYQSLEKFIKSYLTKNALTIEQHIFDGNRRKFSQNELSHDLAQEIYINKNKIHDIIGDRATK